MQSPNREMRALFGFLFLLWLLSAVYILTRKPPTIQVQVSPSEVEVYIPFADYEPPVYENPLDKPLRRLPDYPEPPPSSYDVRIID